VIHDLDAQVQRSRGDAGAKGEATPTDQVRIVLCGVGADLPVHVLKVV
jgi:hypothetical protein